MITSPAIKYCKPFNFARDLISLILQTMKIRKIKYLQKFKCYFDSNSKTSRFAKLSTCKNGSNLQFAKLSPHEIKVFYSIISLLHNSKQLIGRLTCIIFAITVSIW